ncbi:Type 1 glutamine amidotransferase-like domain-containing protein [Sporanaerobacter sp. PP17-6a]|jgi:peptidase E|uniref:Type 1 glutamine amidotransferase-like domain-containing protein n=1 Tax=Sporanaerobacter sp. PP17-6a TaxID=1891289 RepID=UPI00089FF1CD|nr:Type 1 glutamine amidotransferase-like domain-containing protein [Sporanaerobacter sp. PP17-6a]MBE6083177.1 peptidase S51 [Tissierellaceae bacterium]SCL83821.1 Peptidase E [Sporanaerobacter sp. PP17-6a]
MINILLSQYNFHDKWANGSVQKYIDTDDKVAVIPFSFNEKLIGNATEWENAYNKNYGKYYQEIVEPFLQLGIKEENITLLNFFEDKEDDMKRIIEDSNVVFLTGGLPDMAAKRILEKNLLKHIDNEDKVIIGASAGALIQLSNYHITPDKDYSEFMYLKGLGLIKENFYVEVHYAETDLQKNCIQRVLKEKTDTVYAIKDTGGIILDNNIITLLGDVVTFKEMTRINGNSARPS